MAVSPVHRCEVHGDCFDHAVGHYRCTTDTGGVALLWACAEHAEWWESRHPEAFLVPFTPTAPSPPPEPPVPSVRREPEAIVSHLPPVPPRPRRPRPRR